MTLKEKELITFAPQYTYKHVQNEINLYFFLIFAQFIHDAAKIQSH